MRIPKLYDGRDRTFIFFAGEAYGENLHYPDESITSVPTVLQKRGDFSRTFDNAGRLMTIYDPSTGRADGANWVRNLFPGNVIPANQINPNSAKIVSLYPDPNSSTPGSPDWQNNFVLSPNPGRFDFHNYNLRIDHNVSARNRLYGRWSWNRHESFRIKNAIPGIGADHQTAGKTNNGLVVDWVSTLSSGTVFNFRTSLTRWEEYLPGLDHGFNATQWGWPKSLVDQLPIQGRGGTRCYPTSVLFIQDCMPVPTGGRVPYISVASYGFLGSNSFLFEPTNVFSLQPNVALIRGRHTIKAGLDFRLSPFHRPAARIRRRPAGFRPRLYAPELPGAGRRERQRHRVAVARLPGVRTHRQQRVSVLPDIYSRSLGAGRYQTHPKADLECRPAVGSEYFRRQSDTTAPTATSLPTSKIPISSRIDQTRFPGFKVKGGIGFAGVNGLSRTPFDTDYNNIQPRIGAAFQLNRQDRDPRRLRDLLHQPRFARLHQRLQHPDAIRRLRGRAAGHRLTTSTTHFRPECCSRLALPLGWRRSWVNRRHFRTRPRECPTCIRYRSESSASFRST